MMKTRRNYENGYLNKIAYHLAAENHANVDYFTERQIARYGDLSCDDMVFISKEVASIKRQFAIEDQEFLAHIG